MLLFYNPIIVIAEGKYGNKYKVYWYFLWLTHRSIDIFYRGKGKKIEKQNKPTPVRTLVSDQGNKIAISFEISHLGVKLKVTGLYKKCYKENIYHICAI